MKRVWNKEEEKLLIQLIEENANRWQLEYKLKRSYPLIVKKLKEMGFEGMVDARRVLHG